jgi:6-phosphogluconolactonase (cycloisomerase 2 family)
MLRLERLAIIGSGLFALVNCTGATRPVAFTDALAAKRTQQCPCIYVTNFGSRQDPKSVIVFGTKGNKIQNINGSYTGLFRPAAVAVDANRNIYVANSHGNQFSTITVYSAASTGNVPPIQEISGTSTRLDEPKGIALDPVSGNIYVANEYPNGGRGSITVYSPYATGNVAPIAEITGTNTLLYEPIDVALDASGNIYVANYTSQGYSSINVFPAGTSGNVSPIEYITGSTTQLYEIRGIAADASQNIYATNYDPQIFSAIDIYSKGSNGNVAPSAVIEGSNTELNLPLHIALDESGDIYVPEGQDTVLEFGRVPMATSLRSGLFMAAVRA